MDSDRCLVVDRVDIKRGRGRGGGSVVWDIIYANIDMLIHIEILFDLISNPLFLSPSLSLCVCLSATSACIVYVCVVCSMDPQL